MPQQTGGLPVGGGSEFCTKSRIHEVGAEQKGLWEFQGERPRGVKRLLEFRGGGEAHVLGSGVWEGGFGRLGRRQGLGVSFGPGEGVWVVSPALGSMLRTWKSGVDDVSQDGTQSGKS